jgi:pimeloyl-ACP methyl ester carboxylesterase
MADDRIHRAVSADGTEIAGRVHGQGPPLVLVHGALADGDMAWEAMVPHLVDRFTCFLPSTRGCGLSGDSPDHSPPRLVEDLVAFADSIGEPVRIMGESDGGTLALGVAQQAAAVAAVVAYEPFVASALGEDDLAGVGELVRHMNEAAAEGRLIDAARAFARGVANDDEFAALEAADYAEQSARYVPVFLRQFEQALEYEGPEPTDPEELAKISVPVLLLRGKDSGLWVADAVRHVSQHLADPHVPEPLPGAGHWGPTLAPEPIARESTSFFVARSAHGGMGR